MPALSPLPPAIPIANVTLQCCGCGARRPVLFDAADPYTIAPCSCGSHRWKAVEADAWDRTAVHAFAMLERSARAAGLTLTPKLVQAVVSDHVHHYAAGGAEERAVSVGLRSHDGRFDIEIRRTDAGAPRP